MYPNVIGDHQFSKLVIWMPKKWSHQRLVCRLGQVVKLCKWNLSGVSWWTIPDQSIQVEVNSTSLGGQPVPLLNVKTTHLAVAKKGCERGFHKQLQFWGIHNWFRWSLPSGKLPKKELLRKMKHCWANKLNTRRLYFFTVWVHPIQFDGVVQVRELCLKAWWVSQRPSWTTFTRDGGVVLFRMKLTQVAWPKKQQEKLLASTIQNFWGTWFFGSGSVQ